eukprot:6214798-Pleurochrysis_carterae.AAC.2
MVDAILRCERASARLRAALAVPTLDPDHDYLRSWVNRVGACDLDDLNCDEAHLDSPAPERASPALALHPFTPLILFRQVRSLSHRLGCSPRRATLRPSTPRGSYLTPQCFKDLQAWVDTVLDDLTTAVRDEPEARVRPQPPRLAPQCALHNMLPAKMA